MLEAEHVEPLSGERFSFSPESTSIIENVLEMGRLNLRTASLVHRHLAPYTAQDARLTAEEKRVG